MARRLVSLLLAAATIAALHTPVQAGPYDLITVDKIDLTLCDGCGIMLAELGYALLVNTGTEDITIEELRAVEYQVTSSVPEISLWPIINIPNEQLVGAVHPKEAMGSMHGGNQILLTLIGPDETLRDLGHQFMAFQVERPVGSTYEGPVEFDIHMVLAGHELRYRITADLHLGTHAIGILNATRVTRERATAVATAARPKTWGAIKALYRR